MRKDSRPHQFVRRLVGGLCGVGLLLGVSGGTAKSESRSDDDETIVVASFNIHHGEGSDGTIDLSRIADTIRGSGADVVGLQEVDRHFDQRSGFEDQLAILGEQLNMDIAFGAAIDLAPQGAGMRRRQYGNAVLSKYPITSSVPAPLPTPGTAEPRAAVAATIQAGGTSFDVVVTHLGTSSEAERDDQAVALLDLIGSDPVSIVVLLDANARPTSSALATLLHPLSDAWSAERDPGFTHPSSDPQRRIDFVLTSPDLTVLAARVPDTDASDHRPVVASLTDESRQDG